jgi:multidrug efflux pump subunit AcrA (membrane-fusion protein)
VFVAEADTVRKVEIRTGLADESHVEVLDGLERGAFVVSLGQGGLRNGSKVEVLNAKAVGWVPPPAPSGTETADEKDVKPKKSEGASVAVSDGEHSG